MVTFRVNVVVHACHPNNGSLRKRDCEPGVCATTSVAVSGCVCVCVYVSVCECTCIKTQLIEFEIPSEAAQMAQQSRALAALGEDPSLVPSSQDHSNLPDLSPAPASNLISSNSSRAAWELKLQPTHALNPAPEGLMPS